MNAPPRSDWVTFTGEGYRFDIPEALREVASPADAVHLLEDEKVPLTLAALRRRSTVGAIFGIEAVLGDVVRRAREARQVSGPAPAINWLSPTHCTAEVVADRWAASRVAVAVVQLADEDFAVLQVAYVPASNDNVAEDVASILSSLAPDPRP